MNVEGSDMKRFDSFDSFYREIRLVAAADPRRARELFLAMVDGDSPELNEFIDRLSSPGEGRLRHLVANAVRARPDLGGLTPYLVQWLQVETDEFAKRALVAALADVDQSVYKSKSSSPPTFQPSVVEAYRYVASRLHHQMRNALMKPSAQLLRLAAEIARISDDVSRATLSETVGKLGDDLRTVARQIEDFDLDDQHFRLRNVRLWDWIVLMNGEYARSFIPIDLTLICESGSSCQTASIIANDYWLRIIFWNLWINAQQAVGRKCRIELRLCVSDGRLSILQLDNGEGLPSEAAGFVFSEPFSTKGGPHGRGMLEVMDAVERLHGDIRLVEHSTGSFRVRVSFPIE